MRAQPSRWLAEPFGTDGGHLLDEDPRSFAAELDERAKGPRRRRTRCRRDEHGAQCEQFVGLNDHGEAGAALLTTTSVARDPQPPDLPANHVQSSGQNAATASMSSR